jgi:CheY-like chemotaxis protein
VSKLPPEISRRPIALEKSRNRNLIFGASQKADKCDSCELNDPHVIVESSHMSRARLSNLTIVVVEDHNDTRRFLGIFLGHLGASVVVAGNAIEGLEAVKTYRPDLVLSDISMPGRDGFGLLSDIRALGPDAGGSVPVVAMTAFVDRARILNAGFKAFLSKPFSPETLVGAILTALND